jgi:Carboxylesterase family
MTIPEALELTDAFSNYVYSRVLYSQELVTKLQTEPVEVLLSVRGSINERWFYPFRSFGPVIENYSPLEKEDPSILKALEESNDLLWQSVKFPRFFTDRPRILWENLQHNIPLLIGYSEFYGEQWVEIIEAYIKNLERLRTDVALRLFLNLDTSTDIGKVLRHYKLRNKPVFGIERAERDRYIKMFNSRFYNHPLLAHITQYNNNPKAFRRLYLYFLNDHVRSNDAELYHLFPPSFQTVFEASLPVISIFEEFISSGQGPFHSPCIFDEEHKDSELCTYYEVNINADGGEETAQPKGFNMSAVDFWNMHAELLDF